VLRELRPDRAQALGLRRKSDSYYILACYPPQRAMGPAREEEVYRAPFDTGGREVVLYVHLPFCSGHCSYCHFFITLGASEADKDRYAELIRRELALLWARLRAGLGEEPRVVTVYVGGGTPVLMGRERLTGLLGYIREESEVANGAEFTLELHPEFVRGPDPAGLVGDLLANGVTRFNIGAESLDEGVLKVTNRRHTADEALKAYELAREAGCRNVNVDLIYGQPLQTLESWERDLERVAGLGPDSATAYFMHAREGTAAGAMYRAKRSAFPSDEDVLLMRVMARERFSREGYVEGPTDWFAKPQRAVFYRPSVRKEAGWQLAAVGAGTYGYVNGWQYQTALSVPAWEKAVAEGRLPVWKAHRLSERERATRALMFGLRSGGVDPREYQQVFGHEPRESHPALGELEAAGLVEEVGGRLHLSYLGTLFADEAVDRLVDGSVREAIASNDARATADERRLWGLYNRMIESRG
jgi:oxygen-independent coproporphyrinogen-3 oxidase